MIHLTKPKFWDNKKISFYSLLLFPFSLMTIIIIFLKKKLFKTKFFNTPIICVGNIYIGGTGKTPTSIFLAEELLKLKREPVILRKYYKNHNDEYEQIKNRSLKLITNKNRVDGIIEAERASCKTVILDDGLQDYEIKKNLEIVCFNSHQLIGNGLVLPSGPLRENLSSLKNKDIIIINGKKNTKFEEKILKINKNLEIFYSIYKPVNIHRFENVKLLALAGIANPENFFTLLEENKLNVEEKLIFPDHYRFKKDEIESIINNAGGKKLKVIMTEKDFFKIKQFNLKNVDYLKVSLDIIEKEKLINRIKKIYD